jgi:hypothetical protein
MIANKKYATDSNLAKKRRVFFHDATGLLDDILGQLLCTRSLRSDRSGCKARMLELLPLVASSRCENVLDKIIGSGSEFVPSLCFFCIRNGSFLGCCYLCYACRDHQLPLLATKIHFALFTGKERKPHELTVVTLVRPVPEAGSVDIHPMQDSTVLALCHQRRSSIIVQPRAVLGQQFSRDTCVFFSLLNFYRKPAEPCKIQVWDLVLIAIHRIRALS